MDDKLFNLLNQLKAVQILLECDGNEMMVCEDHEKIKYLQEEVDALSSKEVNILDELRHELLHKEEPKDKETKPKITKKEIVVRSNGRKK
jgi:hypothetical protein